MRICYIAGDVEGSHGKPVLPEVSNLISVGMVVVGGPEQHFYIEIKPMTPFWDPKTEDIHRMTPAYLERYGTEPRIAMRRCSAWVQSVAGSAAPLYCAMPLSYDWELLNLTFRRTGVANPFHHALDGRVLYRSVRGLPIGSEVSREEFSRDFPTDIPHLHHALGDALEYEEQVRAMLHRAGRI